MTDAERFNLWFSFLTGLHFVVLGVERDTMVIRIRTMYYICAALYWYELSFYLNCKGPDWKGWFVFSQLAIASHPSDRSPSLTTALNYEIMLSLCYWWKWSKSILTRHRVSFMRPTVFPSQFQTTPNQRREGKFDFNLPSLKYHQRNHSMKSPISDLSETSYYYHHSFHLFRPGGSFLN